ncbi:DUF4397 domain-containing protein [Halorussus gelatinilyticus]|uniref:DUF4397 domain-containing protein n=1 Tax=Halorussus gelatinilyticus TaxID=2937524 RepID=A0A8U0IJ57_9EURY|nr:DUF4397 domain-containing protein [Halorussus gelatinilyticus]UPW00109.1 DUF4397 domain-containing protein [Halorussus gelatinilyticus]
MWGNQTTVTRRLATLGVALLVMTSFAGIGVATLDTDDSQSEDAQVRVAHLSPDAGPVDVLVDGQPVLEGVEFGTVSDYLALPAGDHTVTIRTAENETVLFEGNVSVEAGNRYTIAAIGEVSEDTFRPAVFRDNFETPSDGNATVRLIHASPDAPAVDVTVAGTDTVLYDNVSFGNASEYVSVPAGDYGLQIRPATADNDGEVVTTVNVSLESGAAYTAIASGYLSPDDEPADAPFELILATDSGGMMGTTTGMMGTETETMGNETMGNETTTEEM